MLRLDIPELLDEHDAPAEDVERSLRDLRRFNRFAGGTRVYRAIVRRLLGGQARAVIIDLGAGTADLLDGLCHPERSEGPGWAGLRAARAPRPLAEPALEGLGVTIGFTVAVDWNIRHLLYDRASSRARRVVADARHLPFRDNAADAVTSSHFFHHFTPEENVAIARESLRVARVGVAMTDTLRHAVPLLFTLLLRWFHLVGRITAFDAPASVRRGYTLAEVQEIAEQSGASRIAVDNYVPYRWGMLLWK